MDNLEERACSGQGRSFLQFSVRKTFVIFVKSWGLCGYKTFSKDQRPYRRRGLE